jgi:hypothetical protein
MEIRSLLSSSGALVVAMLAIIGCSSSSPSTDAGIGTDARAPIDSGSGDDSGSTPGIDASVDAGPADGGCDVSPEPADLPALEGGFAVLGADGGIELPSATGGDPTGTFVFERATFWVGAAQAEMFDESISTVEGSAWAAFDGTEARIDFEFVTSLMGTVVGTLVRPSSTQIRGSYTLDEAFIVITPSCRQSSAMAPAGDGGVAGSADLQFSQSGDELTLISRLSGPTGMITIVLEGTRRTL